jgi:hypothetical protein
VEGTGGREIRKFPAIGGKEEVDCVVVHFGLTQEVTVYHGANWGCSVCCRIYQ